MISHSGRRRAAISAKISKPKKSVTPKRDHVYDDLLVAVSQRFDIAVDCGKFFRTDADPDSLWNSYLGNLPSQERQFHNCHCCRNFIQRYGDLVTIDDAGRAIPVMWPKDAPGIYAEPFGTMHLVVSKARVAGPFLAKESVWGLPRTGDWTHLSVMPPATHIYREGALIAGQRMAELRENYKNVITALGEFKAPLLDEAIRILEADALSRSEKFLGPIKWLRALHERPKGRAGENMLWRAIADASDGYCHPRSSVVAPLLADIALGLPFVEIKKRFEAMLHPLRYQRPQAEPKAGNIAAAETLVEKLGLMRSLERRFARLDDLETIWRPRVAEERNAGGVFGHLKAKADAVDPIALPGAVMTWEKFARTTLPGAQRIEIVVPSHGSFIGMTAPVHVDAPPLFKWDNGIAWYCYHNGSSASQWGLSPGWAKVTAVAALPCVWGARPMPFLNEGVVLVIDGARDLRPDSLALFPECLRDDLHGARSVIEAHSRSRKLEGFEEASACGYDLRKSNASCKLRVFSNGAWSPVTIDRWD